jgi:hypothetical protein
MSNKNHPFQRYDINGNYIVLGSLSLEKGLITLYMHQ